ncbi:MAG: dockerin type I repeat-containing protein [Ruminococcus sp.]|nr:dockerin type I repeat-containing protein [Ruminococcus sp.]MDE7098244.1 dockerin type I repeat-containing protein [Ruminococcus sp.]
MKKTPKTILMAALFASAISATSTGAVAGNADYVPSDEQMQDAYGPPVIEETTTPPTVTDPITETTIELAGVYGPPPNYSTTTKTQTTAKDPITETTTDMACVYGPPPDYSTTQTKTTTTAPTTMSNPITETTTDMVTVYGPPPIGDINADGKIDVFDFIELRKMLLDGTTDYYKQYMADVNNDGQVGMADLVMLNNYLLGKIDNFSDNIIPEPQPTTTRYYDNTTVNTVTTTQNTIPAPVYGPPSWFTTQTTVTTPNTTTEPVPQPEYGAPIAFN